MRIGYFLSCEEYTPHELVDQAWAAADAGFDCLWISDHYHPWNDEQGQSAFVWSVIGAVSQICELPVTTAVTCPTTRIHPAVIAQAAASCAVLLNGRLTLGVGTGEALNEHITGEVWPHADVRLEMLEEAVDIIRRLWSGEVVSHDGRYYTVDTARIYSLPEEPPPIYVSGFGPKSIELAGRIGDGFISTQPDAEALLRFRAIKGAEAPAEAGVKVAYASTAEEGIDHAHRLWANAGVPGELSQVLPSPQHFEQAAQLVTREMTAKSIAAGPDPEAHLAAIRPYLEAGYETVTVANMGPHYREMIKFYGSMILPELRSAED
jgi:G6PDH family F420-dependent oxidoreductase